MVKDSVLFKAVGIALLCRFEMQGLALVLLVSLWHHPPLHSVHPQPAQGDDNTYLWWEMMPQTAARGLGN